jgi:hypothetical protein
MNVISKYNSIIKLYNTNNGNILSVYEMLINQRRNKQLSFKRPSKIKIDTIKQFVFNKLC